MENLLNKEPVIRVSNKLKEFNENLNVIVLDSSARTAQDAANSLKTEVGSIIKSLFLRTKSSFLLCLIAGDKRCSLNKVKKILNEKDVSMASADQVKEMTGFTIGGVSPVGHLNPIKMNKNWKPEYANLPKVPWLEEIDFVTFSDKREQERIISSIEIKPIDLSDKEINQLYNHPKVKSFISFTHGEGFGRPLLEATMTGLPDLATVNKSSTRDPYSKKQHFLMNDLKDYSSSEYFYATPILLIAMIICLALWAFIAKGQTNKGSI